MKKISILIPLLFLLLTSVASAANWQWITSTDDYGYFFETQSLRYTRGAYTPAWGGTAEYWMRTVFTPSSAAHIAEVYEDDSLYATSWTVEKQRINFTAKTVTFFGDTTYYNESGSVIRTISLEPYTIDIIPGTVGETILDHIQNFCQKGFSK